MLRFFRRGGWLFMQISSELSKEVQDEMGFSLDHLEPENGQHSVTQSQADYRSAPPHLLPFIVPVYCACTAGHGRTHTHTHTHKHTHTHLSQDTINVPDTVHRQSKQTC